MENQPLENQLAQLQGECEKIMTIISYDLGSPLNSLKSMVDLLMLDVQMVNNPMLTDSAHYLCSQIEILQQRMSNLIEWSSLRVKNYQYQPESFEVCGMIEKLIEDFQKSAQNKGIAIHFLEKKESGVLIKTDRKMMRLVIQNLLSNAVKFSRKGDQVEIRLEETEDNIKISLNDTGIGMSPAKIQAIFQVERKNTQRGTANEAGLGLGMPIVKTLLDLQKIPFEMSSERGKGTSFSMMLPKGEK